MFMRFMISILPTSCHFATCRSFHLLMSLIRN